MRVFVINLARRPDRLEQITRDLNMHGVSFERIDAIDSQIAPIAKQFRRPFFKILFGGRRYGKGTISNYLSFRCVWQKMVDENISAALILEDDAQIFDWDPAFLNLNIADYGIDILRLGANIEPTHLENAANIETPRTILGRRLVTGELWGNVATIMTLTAAKKFLRIKKFWFPSDDYDRYEKCFGISYAIVCPLVWHNSGSDSDLEPEIKKLTTLQTISLGITRPLRKRVLFPAIELYLRLRFSDH